MLSGDSNWHRNAVSCVMRHSCGLFSQPVSSLSLRLFLQSAIVRLDRLAGAKMMLGDPKGAEKIYRRLLDRTDPWEYHNRGVGCGVLLIMDGLFPPL